MVSRDVVAVIVVNGSLKDVSESDKVGVSLDRSELVVGIVGGDGQVGVPQWRSEAHSNIATDLGCAWTVFLYFCGVLRQDDI